MPSDSQLTSFQILPGFMQLPNHFPELLDLVTSTMGEQQRQAPLLMGSDRKGEMRAEPGPVCLVHHQSQLRLLLGLCRQSLRG